jgi:ribonuclease Z
VNNFAVTVLGTASALPMANKYPSAQVLSVQGRLFLIDCGEATQMQLRKAGVSFLKIEAIFLSHTHGDHVFGIFGLLSTMSMLGRTQALTIYAPSSFAPMLDFIRTYYGEGVNFSIDFVPLEHEGVKVIYDSPYMKVQAFPLQHRVPCYGYLFSQQQPGLNVKKDKIETYHLSISEIAALKRGEDLVRKAGPLVEPCMENEYCPQSGTDEDLCLPNEEFTYYPYEPRSYAYCSDTRYFPELASWVKGVNLLYHEATYPEEMAEKAQMRFHATASQAAQCAKEAGAERLMIGHFSSKYPDHQIFLSQAQVVFPHTVLAKELESYEI